jgi:hypothetical protein
MQVAFDGWSDAPLGLHTTPQGHGGASAPADAEAHAARQRALRALAACDSLLRSHNVIAAQSDRELRELGGAYAAGALERLAEQGTDVARGDANAFLLLDCGMQVARLCAAVLPPNVADAAGLSVGVLDTAAREARPIGVGDALVALWALGEFASAEVDGAPLVPRSHQAVQARSQSDTDTDCVKLATVCGTV